MLTTDQQKTVFHVACFALIFLVHPERREQKPTGMEKLSDSACFRRLHDLLWTFRDAKTIELLNEDERAALTEFTQTFNSLPWRPVVTHPGISELPNDDLSPLVPPGEKLLKMFETRMEGF